MPITVEYSTVLDAKSKLSAGGDRRASGEFSLHPTAPRYPSILAFRILADGGTNLTLVVRLNTFNVFQATVIDSGSSDNVFRTVHEIIEVKNPPILKDGVNTVEFEMPVGSGGVTCSDVVLWWKKDV